MTFPRRVIIAVAAVLVAVAAVFSLTGCTVTITAKSHSWGGYYLCDGSQPRPCRPGYAWRVTKAQYDSAHVGQSVTFN